MDIIIPGMTENLKLSIWENLSYLAIDDHTKFVAEGLFEKFKASDPEFSTISDLILIQSCSLVASLGSKTQTLDGQEIFLPPISLSDFIKTSPNELQNYLSCLSKLLTCISPSEKIMLNQIIADTEISMISFKKFKEIWEKIQMKGNEHYLTTIIEIAWLLIINLKKKLAIKNICDMGYLMISVYEFLLKSIKYLNIGLNHPYINELCNIVKANPEKIESWTQKIPEKIKELIDSGDLLTRKNKIECIFASGILEKNISMMLNLYQSNLALGEFDERNFLLLKQKIRTPYKPRFIRNNNPQEITIKVLKWDENVTFPSFNSKLNEIKANNSNQFMPPPTPMSMAMELNNWFCMLIENIGEKNDFFNKTVPEYIKNIVKLKIQDKTQAFFSFYQRKNAQVEAKYSVKFINESLNLDCDFLQESSAGQETIQELNRFSEAIISGVLEKEYKNGKNYEEILKNQEFLSGIFSCCVEAFLYIKNITNISFDEVIEVTEVKIFEFWSSINAFFEFSSNIPHSLKRHFREIDIKIITFLIWKPEFNLNIMNEIFSKNNPHESNLFLRRLLSYSAQKIIEITDSLNIFEPIKEEIWSAFRYLISEKTDLLINRHVDHNIICTIFGVCKLHLTVSFMSLIDKYRQFSQADMNFLKKVYIKNQDYEDIIAYYNTIYIREMKDFLTHKIQPVQKIDLIYPKSPIKANISIEAMNTLFITNSLKSPVKSNFQTPRTEMLLAKNEALAPNFGLILGKKLDLDTEEPTKRPKIIHQILEFKGGDIPAPVLRKSTSEF